MSILNQGEKYWRCTNCKDIVGSEHYGGPYLDHCMQCLGTKFETFIAGSKSPFCVSVDEDNECNNMLDCTCQVGGYAK